MMTNSHFLRHLLVVVALTTALFLPATVLSDFSWTSTTTLINKRPVPCQGTVAGCAADELDMDSEFNRRILQENRYISYGSLQANNVPCSRQGASYYNCQPGGESNPYTRTCSAATQCRS